MVYKPEDNADLFKHMKSQIGDIMAQQALPPKPKTGEPENADRQFALSEEMIATVSAIGTVDGLPQPTKDESIEEARKILRWLRNMEFGDMTVEQWLDSSPPKVVAAKKEAILKLVRILAIHIHNARLRSGALSEDDLLNSTADAISSMALSVAEHTLNMLGVHARMQKLEAMIDDMDDRATLRQEQAFEKLLDMLEMGLERATGQEVSEVSAGSRLSIISEHLSKTAYQLHDPKTLEHHHEESLELAADTLHKMQRMSFGNQTIKDLIENGKPEDKIMFANTVSEMLEMYKNMLAEAVATNPDIAQDERIRAANAAAGQFAHAVKLMAIKEIPVHEAATQQISADVAQMPEHWGDLHDRTIDRLIDNAEEGLEKAMEAVQEQQDQDMAEEMAQDAAEQAQQHDSSKRKKKKKRGDSKGRSGKGGKKSRRVSQDLNADDAYLKQGRFAVDAEVGRLNIDSPVTALRPEEMELVRRLGSSLRDIGNQLKDLGSSITNVSANDKITASPNEQTAAQRILDTEQPARPNPRGTDRGV